MNEQFDKTLKSTSIAFSIMGIRGFNPQISQSDKWLNWVTNFSVFTCLCCAEKNGKIYDVKEREKINISVHPNCACFLENLLSIEAGTATINGYDGADYWIKNYKVLPQGYTTKEEAKKMVGIIY